MITPSPTLLGEVRQFKGGQVAELGHWLVVFKNNKPSALYGTGVKVRKLLKAPAIGARVALLNTMPQDIAHEIRDIATLDGYTIPLFTVRFQVRLTPEDADAAEVLVRLIDRDGVRFFDSIEAEVRHQIEEHVRTRLHKTSAESVLRVGPLRLVFPAEKFELRRPDVAVTAIQGIDWEEGNLAREVRVAKERDIAERAKEDLDRDARDRLAKAQAHQRALDSGAAMEQQLVDAELARRELSVVMDRASALGLDPIAIAEPDVWRTITEQHGAVLAKLLESQHLYPMLRSSPDLMRAIVDRLGGGTSQIPMGRQADMVLDGVDPARILELPGATVHSAADSADYLSRGGLIVDPILEAAWKSAGGRARLAGAGFTPSIEGRVALILLVGSPEPDPPAAFATLAIDALSVGGPAISKVGVYTAEGHTLLDALTAFVSRMNADVSVSVVLRQVKNKREVLVSTDGPPEACREVFGRMTNPSNPILPAMEALVGGRAQIRFLPPGV